MITSMESFNSFPFDDVLSTPVDENLSIVSLCLAPVFGDETVEEIETFGIIEFLVGSTGAVLLTQ